MIKKPILILGAGGETCLPAGRWYTHKDMYFVYVLKSAVADFYYKGITNDIERRIREHETGNNKFTKRYLPVKLVHAELCDSRIEARELEKFFKSGFGREIIREIVEEE